MVEEIKKQFEEEKAEVHEGWKRIEELGKEMPKSLPKTEEPKKLEDKEHISPLNRMLLKVGFKKESPKVRKESVGFNEESPRVKKSPKGEAKDWIRVKSNVD